jgi:hypothetical protein
MARGLACLAFLAAGVCWSAGFHVSPTGSDTGEGTRQAPFATLARAVSAAREWRHTAVVEPVTVVLRGGTYRLSETVTLGPGDSGLTIEAAPGETPVVSGGCVVTGWKPFRGAILQADLSALDLPDLAFQELYYDGHRQPLARVPNLDPAHPRHGGFLYNAEIVEPQGKTRFRYRPGELDPARWAHPERATIVFHPSVNYERIWAPVAAVDSANRVIESSRGVYPLEVDDRYYVCNVPEELDAPGEWCVDPDTQSLLFWPPDGELRGEVVVPALQRLFSIQGDAAAAHLGEDIRLEHLDLRGCRGDAVHMEGASSCAVVGCDIRNVGVGVYLGNDTHGCRVVGCDITQTLGDGVSIIGTPGQHERCAGHVVDNNYIRDFGWGHLHNRCGGVYMHGCSHVKVTHNHIHDGPRYAIGMDVGNDCEIAYNHGHHVNIDTCDTGIIEAATAMFWGREPAEELDWNLKYNRGNTIHHNLIHDSGGVQEQGNGQLDYPVFSWGIYLDTHCSNWHVHDNVCYHTVLGGFMLNCGLDNVVENNVFVDGKTNQVQLNPWPEYEIARNRIERNILAYEGGTAALYTLSRFEDTFATCAANLVWASGQMPAVKGPAGLTVRKSWAQWQERGQDRGSVVADPQFVDAANHDYRLRPTSPAFALGFRAIDLSTVGNYEAPERRTWPRPEEPVLREPADYAPPPAGARQPPLRDYEDYAVDEKERGADVGEGLGSVRVTAETAASGGHSLRIVDAAGQRNAWEPYCTYHHELEQGRVHAGFALRWEAGAEFVYEWRDDPYQYHLGPQVRVAKDGWLSANGQPLVQLPAGDWVRIGIDCALGDQATGRYAFEVRLPGAEPQRYADVACAPEFAYLSCVVLMSMTDGPSVVYLDDLELRPTG